MLHIKYKNQYFIACNMSQGTTGGRATVGVTEMMRRCRGHPSHCKLTWTRQ